MSCRYCHEPIEKTMGLWHRDDGLSYYCPKSADGFHHPEGNKS